jgi:hypothetical protein
MRASKNFRYQTLKYAENKIGKYNKTDIISYFIRLF